MVPDGELLRRYASAGSEAAFTTLVERHLNLVFRSALRRVGGNRHAAEDVTQRVFTSLARKAASLQAHPSLAGWLYTSTRFAAAEAVRGEQRRRNHEQEAHAMNELNAPVALAVEDLDPIVDEILTTLPERDRELVLLHFFEGMTFVDVAAATSSSADAVRMRVNRALDRLRGELDRRGVRSTAVALGGALSAHAITASGLPTASAIASAAIAEAGAATAVVGALAKGAAAKAMPFAVGLGLFVAVVAGAYWYVAHFESTAAGVSRAERPTITSEAVPAPATPSPVAATSAHEASVARGLTFSDLPSAQRSILAGLWRLRSATSARGVFVIGPNAELSAGVQPLLDRRFVTDRNAGQSPTVRLMLTAEGTAFCAANQAEIEAYLDFNALPPAARNLLALLWRERTRVGPGLRPSMLIGDKAPNAAGIDLLMDRAMVEERPGGPHQRRIVLTGLGTEFCGFNEAAIEAYSPVANLGSR